MAYEAADERIIRNPCNVFKTVVESISQNRPFSATHGSAFSASLRSASTLLLLDESQILSHNQNLKVTIQDFSPPPVARPSFGGFWVWLPWAAKPRTHPKACERPQAVRREEESPE
jgi:hypothetical protein